MEPTVESLIAEAHEAVTQGQHAPAAELLQRALQRVIAAGEETGPEADAIREDLATLEEMTGVGAFRHEMGLPRLPGEQVAPDPPSD
jgi:hypothetical protein